MSNTPFPSPRRRREGLRIRARSAVFVPALLASLALTASVVHSRATTPSTAVPRLLYTFDTAAIPVPNEGAGGAILTGLVSNSSPTFVSIGNGQGLALQEAHRVSVQGDEDDLDLGDSDFTLRFVGRIDGLGGGSELHSVLSKGRVSDRGFGLHVDASTGRAVLRLAGSSEFELTGESSVDDGEVHELLGVRSGTVARLFVDGVLSASAPIPANLGSTTNSWRMTVGKHDHNGPGTGFNGVVDLAAVYDVALEPADLLPIGSDCNGNGLPDDYEIAAGLASDCDGDGVIDACQGGAVGGDCNGNGICDVQELALGLVPDVNANGVPDDCEGWWALPFGIDSMVVFGDSLSDTGNVFAATGEPAAPYWQGRFSDGPIWIDHLRGFLGVTPSDVRNYAIGGATSGSTNVGTSVQAGLKQQIETFHANVTAGQVPTDGTLFVLWIGGNDFEEHQQLLPTVPNAMVNIESAIRLLVSDGALRILIPNLPDLGAIPYVQDSGDSDTIAAARAGSIGFNANLAELLGRLERELRVDLIHFDVFGLYDEIIADPSQFGFVDAVQPCFVEGLGSPCGTPGAHVFWDGSHPTSAAHRRVALAADRALVTGGELLPDPDLLANGRVEIGTPEHGTFISGSSIEVTGRVSLGGRLGVRRAEKALKLEVNGNEVSVDENGTYRTHVAIDTTRNEQPVVAVLRLGEHVVDRARIVVFSGTPLSAGSMVDEAVVARLTTLGVGPLTDHVLGSLLADGSLDLRAKLLQKNPIDADWGGIGHLVQAIDAGYISASIEVIPSAGRLFVRMALHDVWVDYSVKTWLEGVWDPGIECSGRVTLTRVMFWAELAVTPGQGALLVNVTPTEPLDFEVLGFVHSGGCANVADLAEMLPWIDLGVDQRIRESIEESIEGDLHDPENPNKFEHSLEEALNGLSISGALSDALGADVVADIDGIHFSSSGLELSLAAGIAPAQPTAQRTLAIATSTLPQFGLDPLSGEPYELAVSVALSSLNQLLLARPDVLPTDQRITHMDVGGGPQIITAKLMAALVPAFAKVPQDMPLELAVTATLPPMLSGDPSFDSGSAVYLGQIELSVVPAKSRLMDETLLSVSLDLRGRVELGHDASSGALSVALDISFDPDATTILLDTLNVDEESFLLLLDGLAATLLPSVASEPMTFPIPEINGLEFAATGISVGNGYASAVFDLTSPYVWPDLVIESIEPIGALDIHTPFVVHGRIKNIGSKTAHGVVAIGTTISPDPHYLNGNDGPLVQVPLHLGPGGLDVGESINFSVPNNLLAPYGTGPKTLFVLVDVPSLLDGSPSVGGAGAVMERTETNNHMGVSVLATFPDSFVASVTPPTNLVGGVGPKTYQVRIGRNSVGPVSLWVPFQVTVGSPQLFPAALGGVWLAPGEEKVVPILVDTPWSYGSAGQVNHFTVEARTNLISDSNHWNNAKSVTVGVAVPWWDLRFEIVGEATTAGQGDPTSWRVEVTNVGNIGSPNVPFLTGVVAPWGSKKWSPAAGDVIQNVTPWVAPGAKWTYYVNNFWIYGQAYLGTQYVKVEIHYAIGGFDIHSGGNFDQESITITH